MLDAGTAPLLTNARVRSRLGKLLQMCDTRYRAATAKERFRGPMRADTIQAFTKFNSDPTHQSMRALSCFEFRKLEESRNLIRTKGN
jgi:hypothetical protein